MPIEFRPASPETPEGEVWLVQNGKLTGRITGLSPFANEPGSVKTISVSELPKDITSSDLVAYVTPSLSFTISSDKPETLEEWYEKESALWKAFEQARVGRVENVLYYFIPNEAGLYSTGKCHCGYEFTSKWHSVARLKRWFHNNVFIHFSIHERD
jgi:hypothetical protein